MPARSLVNLDAMIGRADFAANQDQLAAVDNIGQIGLRDLSVGSLILPNMRKPDFQRETNHWSPEQVVSLIECFANGDLIPSVILWRSPLFLFVIDGGHRLSVLRAWIEDDYGDGHISQAFFQYEISKEQKRVAKLTRALIDERVGKFAAAVAQLQNPNLPDSIRARWTALASRALHIQWVSGNAEKAEASFFKINTEGTPLDSIEELLLRNRTRPIAIAARAVIRAGKGHRYWSAFPAEIATAIEEAASELHKTLFDPEVRRPIKTLDLPLGGSKGVRTALQVLIDFMLIACRDQQGKPSKLQDQPVDGSGEGTTAVLNRALRLARRITGNDGGSLGLHPAIYFYGPTGVHSGPMFMGTVSLIGRKLADNNKEFFRTFTKVRGSLENVLVNYKDLIATILQRQPSAKRIKTYESLLDRLVEDIDNGENPGETWLVEKSGLTGKILSGIALGDAVGFSEDTKSQGFISAALVGTLKCPICKGFLDAEKSVSYDHITAVKAGGLGTPDNLQLTHPYCNQAVKGGL